MKKTMAFIVLFILVIVMMVLFLDYTRPIPLKAFFSNPEDVSEQITNGIMFIILLIIFFVVSVLLGPILSEEEIRRKNEKLFRGLEIIDELPEDSKLVCLSMEKNDERFFLKLRNIKDETERCYSVLAEILLDKFGKVIKDIPASFVATRIERIVTMTADDLNQTSEIRFMYVIEETS